MSDSEGRSGRDWLQPLIDPAHPCCLVSFCLHYMYPCRITSSQSTQTYLSIYLIHAIQYIRSVRVSAARNVSSLHQFPLDKQSASATLFVFKPFSSLALETCLTCVWRKEEDWGGVVSTDIQLSKYSRVYRMSWPDATELYIHTFIQYHTTLPLLRLSEHNILTSLRLETQFINASTLFHLTYCPCTP